MKKFPFGLFPYCVTINVREKEHSLVRYTCNPTRHPLHKEQGATKTPHYPPT